MPWVRGERRRWQGRDFRPREPAGVEPAVDLVAADLPARADDPTHWIVEPGGGTDDVQLLMAGQPVPAVHQRVVERDCEGLDAVIEDRGPGEGHRHTDQGAAFTLHVDGAHDPRGTGVPRAHPDRVNFYDPVGDRDTKRVGDEVVVVVGPVRGEWVRNVVHVVPVAQADGIGEVVLDDAVPVAVVADVARQEEGIPLADDALLAEVGRPPIDFHGQLV